MALTKACEKGLQRQCAPGLLPEIEWKHVQPEIKTNRTVNNAGEKGLQRQPEKAQKHLHQESITCSAVVSVCEKRL